MGLHQLKWNMLFGFRSGNLGVRVWLKKRCTRILVADRFGLIDVCIYLPRNDSFGFMKVRVEVTFSIRVSHFEAGYGKTRVMDG